MFCSKCGSLLFPMQAKDGVVVCRCGHKEPVGEAKCIKKEMNKREDVPVMDSKGDILPKTNVLCSKCGHNEAYWVLRQTRSADEPETRIYRCVKCNHSWREY